MNSIIPRWLEPVSRNQAWEWLFDQATHPDRPGLLPTRRRIWRLNTDRVGPGPIGFETFVGPDGIAGEFDLIGNDPFLYNPFDGAMRGVRRLGLALDINADAITEQSLRDALTDAAHRAQAPDWAVDRLMDDPESFAAGATVLDTATAVILGRPPFIQGRNRLVSASPTATVIAITHQDEVVSVLAGTAWSGSGWVEDRSGSAVAKETLAREVEVATSLRPDAGASYALDWNALRLGASADALLVLGVDNEGAWLCAHEVLGSGLQPAGRFVAKAPLATEPTSSVVATAMLRAEACARLLAALEWHLANSAPIGTSLTPSGVTHVTVRAGAAEPLLDYSPTGAVEPWRRLDETTFVRDGSRPDDLTWFDVGTVRAARGHAAVELGGATFDVALPGPFHRLQEAFIFVPDDNACDGPTHWGVHPGDDRSGAKAIRAGLRFDATPQAVPMRPRKMQFEHGHIQVRESLLELDWEERLIIPLWCGPPQHSESDLLDARDRLRAVARSLGLSMHDCDIQRVEHQDHRPLTRAENDLRFLEACGPDGLEKLVAVYEVAARHQASYGLHPYAGGDAFEGGVGADYDIHVLDAVFAVRRLLAGERLNLGREPGYWSDEDEW